MSGDSIKALLQALTSGEADLDAVHATLTSMMPSGPQTTLPDVRIDTERQSRCGYAEVLYAPGKSDEALVHGFQTLLEAGQDCLATRCTPAQGKLLTSAFPAAIYEETAATVRYSTERDRKGRVAVVTAGTSDRAVAMEAVETLRWMSVETELLMDVGVAGPQRFLSVKHHLDDCNAVVVVAGMEGALPSVVGGWVACPVIAVPTSVGYGAAFGGLAALLGMLNSCAANVAVVNIDAGFKAGYLAGMIAQKSC